MKKVKKKGKESRGREAGAKMSVTRNETGEKGEASPCPADPGPLGQLASRITPLLSAPRWPCLAARAQPPASRYCSQAGPVRQAHRTQFQVQIKWDRWGPAEKSIP